jgi:hypothetical protein
MAREAKCNGEQYVVSDENGYYVEYFNDYSDADERVREGNKELRESGEEFGSYAIGNRVNDEDGSYHYEF